MGLRVVLDPNITTSAGASTSEDRAFVICAPELLFWEAANAPFLETFGGPLSDVLAVRFRAHGYAAWCLDRRPDAVQIIAGTGLATPAWA